MLSRLNSRTLRKFPFGLSSKSVNHTIISRQFIRTISSIRTTDHHENSSASSSIITRQFTTKTSSFSTKYPINDTISSSSSSYHLTQNRHFWFSTSRSQIQRLRKQLDENPTEDVAIRLTQLLIDNKAGGEAATILERLWRSGQISVTESTLRQYLKAAASIGRLHHINISSLLTLLERSKDGEVDPEMMASVLATANIGTGSKLGTNQGIKMGPSPSGTGSSIDKPLHMVQAENPWIRLRDTGISLAVLFVVLYLVSLLLDPKATGGMGRMSGGALGGGSAVHEAESSDKTFADVVGADEAKSDLQEIVAYLRDPKRFTRLGGRLPKGILLTGPPGTGKTLLARAVAGEASVPFFHASGSEFEEMYVGVGAKRVRELFAAARAAAPAIIFIDEIDAIGGARQIKDQSALKMTLNQLLVEMDGFAQNGGVLVIGATNFENSLDPALLRPGRFDKRVEVALPDIGGRLAILKHYAASVPMDTDVDLATVARGTAGCSGAELFNLINQAALRAAADGAKAVSMATMEAARDKILMGAERRSAVMSEDTLRATAGHEAGHAVVALLTKGADPIHKATIMPRGRALGMVMQLPDGDQVSMSRRQMLARLDVAMGGRAAEELLFGPANVTSGASNDLAQATRLARAMVTQYGFSDRLGVMVKEEGVMMSAESEAAVDAEVRRLLDESYRRAYKLLSDRREALEMVADGLLRHETLSGEELTQLIDGKPIDIVRRSHRPSRPVAEVALPGGNTTDNKGGMPVPLPRVMLADASSGRS